MTSSTKQTICNAISEILSQNGREVRSLDDSGRLTKDLGFASLDVAQLIAMLEIDLGVDPFARGASIKDISTIGKLVALYEEHLVQLAA